MNKHLRQITHSFITLLVLSTVVFAAEPKLTFYLPFDGSIEPKIAAEKTRTKFGNKDQSPQFAEGISGQGLVTGGNNESVAVSAEGNLPTDQWTISFWVKGLPNAGWNGSKYFETFWTLGGTDGGMMWFYHYMNRATPWLYSRQSTKDDYQRLDVPVVSEQEWHHWVVTWQKGSGAYLYLDGRLIRQSPTQPPNPVKTIVIGQGGNKFSPPESNRIIDEFKIYDTALDAGSVARRYWQEGNFALQPELTITPTSQKITIDGKIDSAEWQNTAILNNFIDTKTWQSSETPTQGKITYDDKILYIALHSDLPAKVKADPDNYARGLLKKEAVKDGIEVKKDDYFAVHFVSENSVGNVRSLYINGLGSVYAEGSEGQPWQPGAIIKSAEDNDGWTVEVAIPLQSLGIDSIKDSDKLHLNIERSWKKLQQTDTFWSPGVRARDDKSTFAGLGTVIFDNKSATIADLQEFDVASGNKVKAQLNLSNPSEQIREVTATTTVDGGNTEEKKITLQPNTAQKVLLETTLKDANGALISVAVKEGAKVLLSQQLPVIMEQVGQLTFWKYPSLGKIRLGWAIQGEDPAQLSFGAQIKDAAGKNVQNVNVKSLSSLSGNTMADVEKIPVGKYTIEAQLKKGDDILQQEIFPYDKQPLPDWLGNQLGISDTPPVPWTDIEVNESKDTLSIWGRNYNYAQNLLPAQIINQGKEMLSAPMRFVVKTPSGTHFSDATQTDISWTKISAVHSSSLRRQKMDNVELSADSFVEYDGMAWLDLTVSPTTSKVLLDGLTLEIPLKKEWAELITPYDDRRLKSTGLLPKDGWKGTASSMPWVGNGNGGIQVFQETTASWIGSKTTEVMPDKKGGYILRVHLVDEQVSLKKPLQFSLGWIASPVKAAPRNHRDWRILPAGGISNNPKGTSTPAKYIQAAKKRNPKITPYFLWSQGWWWLPGEFEGNYDRSAILPVPKEDRKNATNKYYDIEFYSAPYGRLTEMGVSNPWFAQFGDEWVPSTSKQVPDPSKDPTREITKVSQASPSLRDFYAWGYNNLIKEGDVRVIYFDVSRSLTDTNIYRGTGTRMPDGSIEPILNILGTRKTFQRLYTILKEKHPDGHLSYHMSGGVMLPIDSFTDSLVDGENYHALLDRKDNRGYEKVLSVDQYRAEYSAQNNFGPVSIFLPQFERAKSINRDEWEELGFRHLRYVLGLALLHDSSYWWSFSPFEPIAEIYAAVEETGWNQDWKFVPYWQQKYFSAPDGVYTSFYESPDGKKVLLVAMNTSGKDQQISIPTTLNKSTFKDAKVLLPEKSRLSSMLNMPNNDFNMVLLEKLD